MKAENGMTATPVEPIVSPFYERDGITIYCGLQFGGDQDG